MDPNPPPQPNMMQSDVLSVYSDNYDNVTYEIGLFG